MDVLSGRGRVCGCGKRGLERERERERGRGRLMPQLIGRGLRVKPMI